MQEYEHRQQGRVGGGNLYLLEGQKLKLEISPEYASSPEAREQSYNLAAGYYCRTKFNKGYKLSANSPAYSELFKNQEGKSSLEIYFECSGPAQLLNPEFTVRILDPLVSSVAYNKEIMIYKRIF
jgi:hypothetical protein